MLFLAETNESVETVIEEANEGKKSYFIEGIFAQADIKNRNGRFYPKSVLEKQIENQQTLIKEKRALGELNHPSTPNVSLDRVSHLITKLEWSGSNVVGKAKILESVPMGKIAAGLIDEGVKFGVSTRGLGTVKANRNGMNEVQSDFRLVCVDIVSDPSAPDAWMTGLMEGAEWAINPVSGLWEQVKKIVESNVRSRTLTLEQKMKLFKEYTGILSRK